MERTALVAETSQVTAPCFPFHCSCSQLDETLQKCSQETASKESCSGNVVAKRTRLLNSQGSSLRCSMTRIDALRESVEGHTDIFEEIRCRDDGTEVKNIEKRYIEGGGSCKGGVSNFHNRGRGLRPHSTPATLLWLEENYEMAEGVCIPRNTLYQHYVDFCARQGLHPVNAASFGKIIRQQFPGLTTRRLGTRGQSRYHYYGIAIREGSKYFEVHYSKRGNSGCLDSKKDGSKQLNMFQCRGKMSTLPEFPSLKDLCLPNKVSHEKIFTFLMMYKTHCQRILDSVSRANFDEIQSYIHHFWREIPVHLTFTLGSNSMVNIVGVCDSILYRAISNVLIPSVLQAVPERISQIVRKFTYDYESWLPLCLSHLPENLKTIKVILGQGFSKMLRRQISLNHLCQASRMVLHAPEIVSQMIQDWRQLLDLEAVAQQTLFADEGRIGGLVSLQLIRSLSREFERLLEENSPLESFSSWLEGLVDRCVSGASRRSKLPFHKVARSFLVIWTAFGSNLMKNMTSHSIPSFGSFHLLHLTFDELVICLVESLHADNKARDLMSCIPSDALPDLSDPCLDSEFADRNIDDHLPGISFLFGNGSALQNSCTSSSSPSGSSSSGVPQVPLVTSSTTPGLSPSSQSNSDLNISSQSVLGEMEVSMSNEDASNLNFSSSSSTSESASQPSSSVAISTSSGMDATSSALGNDGYNFDAANYYYYENDHRGGYKMSTVGRNYIYSPPTSFNQYYGVSNSFDGNSREDRLGSVSGMDSFTYSSSAAGRLPDTLCSDASSLSYADQSVLYSSTNYHYQPYETSCCVQKCKQKGIEN